MSHICSSIYLTQWWCVTDTTYLNPTCTSCLTVAVDVVLHYLHATNAWTTFSPFIFKYCWDICEDFMSFFWVLLMFISFFMSCDNVMMMCISFLFIELSSNQVCFLHRPSLLPLGNTSRVSYLYKSTLIVFAPSLYLSTAPCPGPRITLALSFLPGHEF